MFLVRGTTICFICQRPIARRVEAAQLQYASPEDVGEVACHGRDWIHRACWVTWPQRGAWSLSSARLMSSQPEMLSARGVTARPMLNGVLITDTNAAFTVIVPREMLDELYRAFGANNVTSVAFDHALWTLTPTGSAIQLTARHGNETFEDLVIEDPAAWHEVLRGAGSTHM